MQYIKNMSAMLTSRVNGYLRWSLVMCIGLMIFGVFSLAGCSSKDGTPDGSQPSISMADLPCPMGKARLAGASKKTTDTCMPDTDGDGIPDSTGPISMADLPCPMGKARLAGASKKTTDTCMPDTDGDGIPDSTGPISMADLPCPMGKARLAGASKKTTDTCMPDTDGDGIPDSTGPISMADLPCPMGKARLAGASKKTTDTCMPDTDGDGIPDSTDVDYNDNGLIEIDSLEKLHNIRYNLAGTSYKTILTPATAAGDTTGCREIRGIALCNGYELTQNLSFDKDEDGETWSNDVTNGYTLDAGDNASPHFVVDAADADNGGWKPIGSSSSENKFFNAIFEGNGHRITGLAIRSTEKFIGIFGVIGAGADIRNISLVSVLGVHTGMSNNNCVGGLVGKQNGGRISNIFYGILEVGGDDINAGDLIGGALKDSIGGFVGCQDGGSIIASYAVKNIQFGEAGDDYVGGLVGKQTSGNITKCSSSGVVYGGAGNDHVGGLVGSQSDIITASYATNTVDGQVGNDYVGGLVGHQNAGSIIASYAKEIFNLAGGSGDDYVGGLVGKQTSGNIIGSYAREIALYGGDGGDYVGGLVGWQGGSIAVSYSQLFVINGQAGNDYVGGLVGWQNSSASVTESYAATGISGTPGRGVFGGDDTGGADNDHVGIFSGTSGSMPSNSYGFSSAIGGSEILGSAGSTPPRNIMSAKNLKLSDIQMVWTTSAWDFGDMTQTPALKYADYDGTDTAGNKYYCDNVDTPTFTTGMPPIPIPNCGIFISEQGRR